jgi:hypothetical protein
MAKICHTQDHWFRVVFWDKRRDTQNFKSYGSIYPLTLKTLRPTLDEGPGSNFLGTNLDSFEANWILELDYTMVPSLILGSPNQELSFFGSKPIIFLPKQVPCRFSLNLPLLGLGPLSKGLGTKLKLLGTNKIAWIHWSLDLEGPRLRSAPKTWADGFFPNYEETWPSDWPPACLQTQEHSFIH